MAHIYTYTHKKFDPFAPDESQIDIEDIAHALSMICRFGGHASRFYSVAEHSVHVSKRLPRHLTFAGLMHDATEAYLIDVPRPIKKHPLMQGYRDTEDNLLRILAEKFGFDYPLHEAVLEADDFVLHAEMPQLFTGLHTVETYPQSKELKLAFWSPEVAKRQFLLRYASC